jgi:hypothetical protein
VAFYKTGSVSPCSRMLWYSAVEWAHPESLFTPLATSSRKRSRGVEVGKEKTTIHLLVFSPHGSKLFLLLPLHFHTRTSGRHLMSVASHIGFILIYEKPHMISSHPTMLVWTPVVGDALKASWMLCPIILSPLGQFSYLPPL